MKKLGKRLNAAKETVETYHPCVACYLVCAKYDHLDIDSNDQGTYILLDQLLHK